MTNQKNYQKTLIACYLGFVTQAITANFAPLLFLTFRSTYGITLDKIAIIPLVFYLTQLLVDLAATKFADKIGYRICVIASQVVSAVGLVLMAILPELLSSPYIGILISVVLYAVGSGGLFGLGLGQSRQKYKYLPEAQNDYIYAVICEELGFIGGVLVILLFVLFVWRGISIALNARDKFGMYTAFGITAIVGLQMLINIGVVLSVLPSTGMQLPLFSSGGSSMLATMWGIGILINISKSSKIKKL